MTDDPSKSNSKYECDPGQVITGMWQRGEFGADRPYAFHVRCAAFNVPVASVTTSCEWQSRRMDEPQSCADGSVVSGLAIRGGAAYSYSVKCCEAKRPLAN